MLPKTASAVLLLRLRHHQAQRVLQQLQQAHDLLLAQANSTPATLPCIVHGSSRGLKRHN
jgi:hypothetical protein